MDFPAPRHRPPSSVVVLEAVDPAELRLDRVSRGPRDRSHWSSCAWAPSTENTAQSSFRRSKWNQQAYVLICLSARYGRTRLQVRREGGCVFNQHIYVCWPDRYIGRRATGYPDPLADLLRYNLSTVRGYLLEEELTFAVRTK